MSSQSAKILYSERQWVPWYWWILGALFVALIGGEMGLNRPSIWIYISALITAILTFGSLFLLSSTRITVEEDSDSIRWLVTGNAQLPHTAVSRSMAVPATAKRNALGHQLDPAAFVVSHGWVPEMAMFVLDDPEDPTPYWLISTKNPDKLLRTFIGSSE